MAGSIASPSYLPLNGMLVHRKVNPLHFRRPQSFPELINPSGWVETLSKLCLALEKQTNTNEHSDPAWAWCQTF